MENAIEIRGLRKRYRGFALEDIAIDVPRGYIMGLIGPNGAGKTTIIKLIMGLIRPEAGEVRLLGASSRSEITQARSRVGFVYETPCFPDDCTLREVRAAVAPFYPRWDEDTFASLLEEFELPARKRLKTLSQGMQTKAALAFALSHHAELIVMDEPTSGLDPVLRRELLDKLAELISDGSTTVLFSTHITSDLERTADFVTFIRAGSIVFSAPREEILETWAILKGGDELLSPDVAPLLRCVRRGAYGVEALTADARTVRQAVGPGAIIERATLEDIMVYMEEASHAPEAHP